MTLTTVLTPQNQTAYDSLYVSLLDGLGTLQLLVAVCENDALRYEMIERYEQALKPEAQVWRVTLDPVEPSLRQALYELTEQQTLTDYSAQIVTVLGAEKLDSEALKKFWGYLQWTREGLRAFPWPIVLWLPQRLLKEMMKKAPDFWRWRGGIFLFTLQTRSELSPNELMSSGEFSSSSSSLFSVEQLEDSLEKAIQQWGEDSPKLASLYGQLGKAYRQQIEQGHYTTFGQEASRAEQLLQKAINQSSQPSDFLAENLNNLASLYKSQGKYAEAEPLIERSLAILVDFAKKQARNSGLDISKLEALLNAMEIDTHRSLSDKYKQMFYLAATGFYSGDDLAKMFDYRHGKNLNSDFNRNLGYPLKSYLELEDDDRVGITSLRRILFKKGYLVSL